MNTKNIIDKNPTKVADNLNDLVLEKTKTDMNCYEKAQVIADVLEEVVEIFEKKKLKLCRK